MMLRPYVGYLMISLLTISLTLTGCTESDSHDSTPTPSPNVSSSPSNPTPSPSPSTESSTEPSAEPSAEPSDDNDQDPSDSARPDQTTLEVSTMDGYQPKTAILKVGEGYSLYVIDGFDFDPSTGTLSLSNNSDYSVAIQPLQDYDEVKQRQDGENELKAFGTVSEYSGELVEHPLGYAELYLQASSGEGIQDHIVWKSEEGDRYLFRLRNPKGEDAPAFAGAVFVMLSTIR